METTKTVLILGATSAIAQATAAALAKRGYALYLAARKQEELIRIANDLTIRYHVKVQYGFFDAEKMDMHENFFNSVLAITNGLIGVIQAFGYMSSTLTGASLAEDQKVITVNYSGAANILTICANYFMEQKTGFIAGISSVAGDRGRQSNYIYGSAKGALNLYLQGLRNRLTPYNIQVLTVKPGFVDTPMTFGKPGLFLVASPNYIGEKIVKAIEHKKDVVYLPWFWRYIMLIIKLIPERIFKQLKL